MQVKKVASSNIATTPATVGLPICMFPAQVDSSIAVDAMTRREKVADLGLGGNVVATVADAFAVPADPDDPSQSR